MSFKISKEQREISVALSDGRELSGYVFLGQSMVNPGESVRVLELLESEERFLPFTTRQGEFLILTKSAIVAVSVPTEHELRSLLSTGTDLYGKADLSVRMTAHDAIHGVLYIEPIEGFSRPFDEINRAKAFLTLHCQETTRILNVRHIVEIKIMGQR